MKKIIYISLALTVFLIGCKDYDPDVKTSDTGFYSNLSTLDLLELRGYTLFVDAVTHAGVSSELFASTDTVTVFAPTNQAFVNYLSANGFNTISDVDASALADVLRYHVSNTPFTSSSNIASLETLLAGKSSYPTFSTDGSIGVNGKAAVVEADLFSTDGVSHGISQVLSAPADDVFSVIANSSNHVTLEGLLVRVGLDATLSGSGTFTVLAPSDQAFIDAGFDAATLAALSDNEVDSLLKFHVIGSRTYQTEFADGKYETLLGAEADGFQEWVVVDGAFNWNEVEIDSDSANFSADNGVVHEIDAVLTNDLVIADFLGGFATLNASATAARDYTSLDQFVTVLVNTQGSDAYVPATGDFADGDEIQDFLETYTFEGAIDFTSLASGTKVESVNGSEFYIQHSDEGTLTLNGVDTLNETASVAVYNGFVNELTDNESAYPTPIPSEDITEVLDNNGYTLLAAMLRVTGKDAEADAQDVTFYAVSDALIDFYFGYSDPADIDTLSAGGEEDVEITDAFAEFLDNQMVPGEVVSSVILNDDLPTQTLANGEEIVWGLIDASGDTALELVVITNPSNPNSGEIEVLNFNIWANNGVIHEMEDIFPEP